MVNSEYCFTRGDKGIFGPESWDRWFSEVPYDKFTLDEEYILDRIRLEWPDRFITVAEAGCGRGKWLRLMRSAGYMKVIGIDYSQQLIDYCSRHGCSDVYTMDIRDMSIFENESVDVFLSWGVLEHLREGLSPALREKCRALKVNGRIYMTLPSNSIWRRLNTCMRLLGVLSKLIITRIKIQDRCLVWFQYHYKSSEVCKEAERAGLTVVDIRPCFQEHAISESFRCLRKNKAGIELNFLGNLLCKYMKLYMPSFFTHMTLYVLEKR